MKTAGVAALWTLAAWGQQPPPIQNAKVETRSAAAGLESTLRQFLAPAQVDPLWVGYTVPAVPRTPRDLLERQLRGDGSPGRTEGILHPLSHRRRSHRPCPHLFSRLRYRWRRRQVRLADQCAPRG